MGTSRLIGINPELPLSTQPHQNISEVGRFLRKRHVGRAGPLEDGSHTEEAHRNSDLYQGGSSVQVGSLVQVGSSG